MRANLRDTLYVYALSRFVHHIHIDVLCQLFVDGDVVDSFVGAKIEPLKKLIYKHLGVDEES